jgi:hypothetical protein
MEIRENYRIADLNLEEVNRILGWLQDRLDELEGRRGTPVFHSSPDLQGNKITNLSQGTQPGEALTADLEDESLQVGSDGRLLVRVNETAGLAKDTDGLRVSVRSGGGLDIDPNDGLFTDPPITDDHGTLSGLDDDDHPQYLNTARHDLATRHADAVLFSPQWTNYFATSTKTGWASYGSAELYYKRIGNLVFVSIDVGGVSNNTAIELTLPYNAKKNTGALCAGYDNGSYLVNPALIEILEGSNNMIIYKNAAYNGWTNTGDKYVWGQFFYEAES